MTLRQSLVIRLTFFISLSTLSIWLVSIFAMTAISIKQEKQRIIEDLTNISALMVILSNHRFEGAEHDAQMLINRYNLSHITLPNAALASSSDSRYFPINDEVCTPQIRQDRDRSFLQLYGPAGQTYYQDSFIMDRHYGISLRSPHNPSPDYFTLRRTTLSGLPLNPAHDNIYWSQPEYIPGNGWSVSVAAADNDNQGVLGGLAVKLNDLLDYAAHPHLGCDTSIWLDQSNHPLPFSSMPDELRALLQKVPPLKDGWQEIPGYLVLRTLLHGPGWQQVILYPLSNVFPRSLSIITRQLPFALTTLALIAATLCWLLHRHLVRPLWDFVDIIGRTGPSSLTTHLPENRQDELGSIARAYNRLLDTLRVQYDNLENKVVERTQALNEARQKAEQASKRKSTHLTAISHELRTPLSGALGAIELLQTSGLNAKQAGLADTARQCTLSLLTIINNLLDFSRIESGHFSLHSEEVALLPLLDQAMQTIQGPAHNKNLALRTFVGQHVPLYLDADATRLRQILVNLLGNALKFTETGGIYLTVKRSEDQLIFAVSDSGKGIPLQDQHKVFAPFFQAEGNVHGTGIGLTIASNLTKMMGGKLELNSAPGLGTCVSLLLPLKKYRLPQYLEGKLAAPLPLHRQLSVWGIRCDLAKQDDKLSDNELRFLPGKLYRRVQQIMFGAPGEQNSNISVQPWRLHVLLVDDAAINRDIIGMMLHSLGQNVTTAASSSEALSLGQQQRFDLVLMDIRMPETDGIECVHLWRCDPNNLDPDCIIVALSANTASEEIARCKAAGMHHYLTKPVTLVTLANSISIAAEYQLRRDIDLQEQDVQLSCTMLAPEDLLMHGKFRHSLDTLLTEIEHTLYDRQKAGDLLHKLKGCLGQAGFSKLLCNVVDMENRLRHGLDLPVEELTKLRQSLNAIFANHSVN